MAEPQAAEFLDRVLVTGASGMIGSAFSRGIKLGRKELDVTDERAVHEKVRELKPPAIVHLASLDLRQCERDPLLAVRTNIRATQYLLDAAQDCGSALMFVSSAAIFFGEKGDSFDEDATPAPTNLYGEAKVISERMLLEQYPEGAVVVRTGWVFGGHGAHHRKFVDIAIERARAGEEVLATRDNDGSPAFVGDLVEEMTALLTQNRRGLYHIANSGAATPWDIAELITGLLGSSSTISPLVRSPEESRIQRSSCEVITSKHIHLRGWREALTEYVEAKEAGRR